MDSPLSASGEASLLTIDRVLAAPGADDVVERLNDAVERTFLTIGPPPEDVMDDHESRAEESQ
ncbi:hypothetical protein [Kitasatospora sp. NPDC097691]|uniref:hypothetical protein n=1 Tax=Kitasatospora sp. NPDC097691 TaxID=3157231 RepID=UPI00332DB0FC